MPAVITPETSRVDRDHFPAWMDENPALFVASVREFLDAHPAEEWECRVSKFAYLTRLTAVRKAAAPPAPKAISVETRVWMNEVQRICEFASTARNMELRDQRNNLEDIANRMAKLHAAMSGDPSTKRAAKPTIGVEVVGVVRPGGEDGPKVEWLLEGGLHAVAEGGESYLLVSHEPITDDNGHGEVYRAA